MTSAVGSQGRSPWLVPVAASVLLLGCVQGSRGNVGAYNEGTVGAPTDGSDGAADSATSTNPTGGAGLSSGVDVDDGVDSDDSGLLLDVGPPGTGDGPLMCQEGGKCSCSGVDLLFVIDNSTSMGGYQEALGLAFPEFAATLDTVLEPGTSVHVGVTSTEMGMSGSGSTTITNGVCSFVGDDEQPNDAFYITPEDVDTGRNGAQGRLYDPGDGQTYFEYTAGSGGADLVALEAWFTSAANIGTGGSSIEMSVAPIGWVADPANAATNAGFIRDEGAVLVLFFMQDEPDQTPLVLDGGLGGDAMLNRLVQAKQRCGGVDCIVVGGFLREDACIGGLPLDEVLAAVGNPVVSELPDDENAAAAAAEMNAVLSGTLADIIVEACDEIPPAG